MKRLAILLTLAVLLATCPAFPQADDTAWFAEQLISDGPGALRVTQSPDDRPLGVVDWDGARSLVLSDEQAGSLLENTESQSRYIIELDLPPAAMHRAGPGRAQAQESIRAQHARFREDLARIRADLKRTEHLRIRREYFTVLNGLAVTLNREELAHVRQLPYVTRVSPDVRVRACLTQSVPLINADDVWSGLGAQGQGTVVAIIDTGVDYTHSALGGGFGPSYKVKGGWDFVNDDSDPMDDHGHGTHVAGIVAANGSLRGVAPQAGLMAYKVLSSSGYGNSSDIIAAVERACDPDQNPLTDDAVDAMNLSLGGPGHPDDPMCLAIDNAAGLGVVCAVAAGNSYYYETIGSPGCARLALTVGATDKSNQIASFSSKGPATTTYDIKPEVCAPGKDITSLAIGGTTKSMSGTSMATPHVAGTAALLRQLRPTWTPSQIKAALMGTALDIGKDVVTQGAGRIDAYAAARTQILIEPGNINLGKDDLAQALWAVTKPLTVTNVGPTPVTCTLTVNTSTLPTGVYTSITNLITLAPGESGTADLQVTVDNTVVPNLYAPPCLYYAWVVAQYGTTQYRIPFAFSKEQPDTFEPNNDAAHATPITVEGKRRQVLALGRTKVDHTEPGASNPDYDWYSFTAEAGQVFFAYADKTAGGPLDVRIDLWNSSLNILATSEPTGVGEQIVFFRIPSTGTYYLRVYGAESEGAYKLYVNFLPTETSFYWTPPSPSGGNPVDLVDFSDGGGYLHASQYYNYLTLFQTTGAGSPLYNLTASGRNSYSLFGASDNASVSVGAHSLRNDYGTWSYDGTDWTRRNPPTGPGPLMGCSMAYDAARGVTILFGGWDPDTGYSNDTWAWDGSTWTKLNPASKPSARYKCGMAYDSNRQVIVLHGGNYDGGYRSDTWEWNGSNWMQKFPINPPPGRFGFGFVYDSNRRVCVMFGGQAAETWEYDGTRWTRYYPATSPTYYTDPAMGYDPVHGETVLITALDEQTWTWNGVSWTRKYPGTVPSLWTGAWNMAFDSARSRILLAAQYSTIGGSYSPYMETWEWDGSNWSKTTTAHAPVRRAYFGLAYDSSRHETILYGGQVGTNTYLWSSYAPQRIQQRVTPNSTPVSTTTLEYPNNVSSLAVSADGSRVITTIGYELQIRNADGTVIRAIPTTGPAYLRRITPDGRLAVLLEDRPSMNYLLVLDLDSGAERFRVRETIGNVDDIHLSDDGARMVLVQEYYLYGYQWDGYVYKRLSRYDPGSLNWIYDAGISGNGAVAMAVVRHWGGLSDLGLSYHLVDFANGRRLAVYRELKDAASVLQSVPTGVRVNYDGSLAVVGSWGGDRSYSEMTALTPECAVPLLELGTPGSAQSVDLKGGYIAVGTKGYHANVLGGRGEVYAMNAGDVLSHIPPLVTDARADPWRLEPGSDVRITCRASDDDGVTSVTAQIESPNENVLASVTLYDDGLHGDGAAGDGVWSNTWTTPVTSGEYLVDILAVDGASNAATYDNACRFTTFVCPWVTYLSSALVGRTDVWPGTSNYYSITLINRGSRTAKSVSARTYCNDPYVTSCSIYTYNYLDLLAGDSRTSSTTTFYVVVSPVAPAGHRIPVNVVISDAEGHTWEEQFELPALVDNVGPQISNVRLNARYVTPGSLIEISADAVDGTGMGQAQAEFESPNNTAIGTSLLYDDGAHNDGAAGDGRFGGSWTTSATPLDYWVDMAATDSLGYTTTVSDAVRFTTIEFVPSKKILLVNGSYMDTETDAYKSALTSMRLEYDYWVKGVRGEVPESVLDAYADGLVIWEMGANQMLDYPDQLSSAQQRLLEAYLDGGGRLIFSGLSNAFQLNGTRLFADYFHAKYVNPVSIGYLVGAAGDPIGDGLKINLSSGTEEIDVQSPAYQCLKYDTTYGGSIASSGTSVARVDSTYKAVWLTFPLSRLTLDVSRRELLGRILKWMNLDLPVDHFDWDAGPSPQTLGVPFGVTMTARDSLGNKVESFAGPVQLGARTTTQTERTLGTGTSTWQYPLNAAYHDARTQSIYLASEIGPAGTISSLSLDVASVPGAVLRSFTIRMKHTSLSYYSSPGWEYTGWTTVYQADGTISSTGWVTFPFARAFEYNGLDNLMVDISFNNSSSSTDGYCRYTSAGSLRSIYYRTNSGAGDPLAWCGYYPNLFTSTYVPNIRLGIGSDALVYPTASGGFADGAWTGSMAVTQSGGVFLRADDGVGHAGVSNLVGVNGGIPEVKCLGDDIPLKISSAVVTGVFGDMFYVEADDRSCGIRADKTGHGLSRWVRADVTGTIRTDPDGERYIDASSVTPGGPGALDPLGLSCYQLGGGKWLYDADTGAGQEGITGAFGLNNIGLLVRVWGKVTHAGADHFYLDDGSRLQDGSGYTGVKVLTYGLPLPEEYSLVQVNGISSCFRSGDGLRRLIRATDVSVLE